MPVPVTKIHNLLRVNYIWPKVVPNEWNHVSLIKDDDSISMYVNGKRADQREIEGDDKN